MFKRSTNKSKYVQEIDEDDEDMEVVKSPFAAGYKTVNSSFIQEVPEELELTSGYNTSWHNSGMKGMSDLQKTQKSSGFKKS